MSVDPAEHRAHDRAMRLIAAHRGGAVYDEELEQVVTEIYTSTDNPNERFTEALALIHQLARITSSAIHYVTTVSVIKDPQEVMRIIDAIDEDDPDGDDG